MANTTNFGWETPDDTDLVKDGAAAMRTLGSAIDTSMADLKGGTTGQVLKKNSNTDMDFIWGTDSTFTSPLTTKGDILVYSTTDTRLPVGTNGQVLLADSTQTTGLKWATPSAQKSFSLLNAGGTALTGSNTITVSGISGIDNLFIYLFRASSASASSVITLRLNTDTGSNYIYAMGANTSASSWAAANMEGVNQNATTSFAVGKTAADQNSHISAAINLNGCNTSGVKTMTIGSAADLAGSSGAISYYGGGIYNSSSAITSVSIISGTGNFDNGTIYIYGAA